LSDLQVGFVGAFPYLVAICTMGFWAKHSDKAGERYWHVAIACAVGGGGLLLAGLLHDYHVLVVLLLSLAIAGVMAARPPFWALPSDFLNGQKAAACIAAINSADNLGGFSRPVPDWMGSSGDRKLHRRPYDFSGYTPGLCDVYHRATPLR
jgi:ACS family tartrate transporter-like MFS transporter